MKRIFSSILLLISVNAFAVDPVFHPDSAYKRSLCLSTEYFFGSNAINNRFALAYFQNEYIDNELKNTVSQKLSSLNRFGGEINSKLGYTQHCDTLLGLANSFYSVSLSNHFHIDSRFSKDVFELYLRGNKSYRGKTADLGKFVYNQLVYQQLNFTFGHTYTRNENEFGYTAGLSLNKGQREYKIVAENATIYTEQYGSYLDLDADLLIQQSDSGENNLSSWNGTGASGDFSFYWTDKNKNTLSFVAENFGFITWNDNSAYIKADTAFRFEGVDVSSLFEFEDSVKETISLDSSLVEPYLSAREKKSNTISLPSILRLSYQYILSPGKTDLGLGVEYSFVTGYVPEITASLGYTLKGTHRFLFMFNYGGYTGFDGGIGYRGWFFDRWMFTVQSNYLGILFNRENTYAQGAFVSLATYF